MRCLRFDRGTLLLEGFPDGEVPGGFVRDGRVGLWRAPAERYHEVVMRLHRAGQEWEDHARAYTHLQREHRTDRTPRDYQREAVEAWWQSGRRGVVVLPTGAGKSFVAELCIARGNRSALIVAPTLDLVGQWHDQLCRAFGNPVGLLGGGEHEVHDITVSTYDSAWMHMERYGGRFGMLVFDEVHHLPGARYSQAALCSIAPFRLGLSATPERDDGSHRLLDERVGPICYRREITELAGEFLADYRTEVRLVHLSDEDRSEYEAARGEYRAFIESRGIRLGGRGGWNHFLREAARSKEGRSAFRAWRRSRTLLQAAPAKLRMLESLLRQHHDGRVIVFTNDNDTVYEISRRFLVPAITHQTPVKERRTLLAGFAEGSMPCLVTSRVLNEGVDIPEADVAVVLSGSGTVREHVQRLGRILRPREGKQAILYELVVESTVEERTSERRRDHAAYRST